MRISSPFSKLKRKAKLLARQRNIKLHDALNQTAISEGYRSWSHLAVNNRGASPVTKLIEEIQPGDLVLVGARPGQGKTLLGLELAARAPALDRQAFFFTLDYGISGVQHRLRMLDEKTQQAAKAIVFDTSDEICADYVIGKSRKSHKKTLIIIDFLQLLDQRRSNPPLEEQVAALKQFAVEDQSIVVMISQIGRKYEDTRKPIPNVHDLRLPNPVNLSHFNTTCFMHGGKFRIEKAA